MGKIYGTLTGAVMVIGLEVGSPELKTFDAYEEILSCSSKLFKKFGTMYETVSCADIQNKFFGREYGFNLKQHRNA